MAGPVERLVGKFERHAAGTSQGLPFDPLQSDREALFQVPVEQVYPDPHQPRRDLGDLESLKASILEHGIIQPLVVSIDGPARFLLIAGERRYTAAKALGLPTVPAVVRTVSNHRRLELQLIENIQRKDLDPFEEADSFRRLLDEFGLSQDELARRLAKSRVSINETLSLARLSEHLRKEWSRMSDRPSKSLLLEVARAGPGPRQERLWKLARLGTLTVQQARRDRTAARPSGAQSNRTTARHCQITVRTRHAVVTVQFSRASASPGDVLHTLQDALRQYRAILRAG